MSEAQPPRQHRRETGSPDGADSPDRCERSRRAAAHHAEIDNRAATRKASNACTVNADHTAIAVGVSPMAANREKSGNGPTVSRPLKPPKAHPPDTREPASLRRFRRFHGSTAGYAAKPARRGRQCRATTPAEQEPPRQRHDGQGEGQRQQIGALPHRGHPVTRYHRADPAVVQLRGERLIQ